MLPEQVDVLIIGGGVLGTAISYHLSKKGIENLVLEKAEIAAGASGSNLGQISLIDREAGTHLALAFHSLNSYRDLEKEWNSSLGLKETGGLFLFYTEEDVEKAKELVKIQNEAGLEVQLLTPEEVKIQEPFMDIKHIKGAAFCPKEGRLDPLKITLGFMEKAQELGALAEINTEVIGFELADGMITAVLTTAGKVKVRKVVLAAGSWTREIAANLGLNYPIFYNRAKVMVTQPTSPVITGPIVPGGFLTGSLVEEKWTYLGAIQEENGSIIIGQATDSVENYDVSMDFEGPVDMAKLFIQHFPTLGNLDIVRMWAGVTPYVEDDFPLFGYSRKIKNLFLAAGFKGAFTVAPAVGEAAADIICSGKSQFDCSAYSPARFEKERMIK